MKILEKIDLKYVVITVALTCAGLLTYVFSSELVLAVKQFFEIKDLNLLAGGIAAIFTLTHKIKTRKLKFSPLMSFTEFRIPVEDILSFIGNPVTLVCSLSLAKGVFFRGWGEDTWGDIRYFHHLEGWEVTFIGIVTAYLFFISLMELFRNIKETLTRDSVGNQEVTPISDSAAAREVPDPMK